MDTGILTELEKVSNIAGSLSIVGLLLIIVWFFLTRRIVPGRTAEEEAATRDLLAAVRDVLTAVSDTEKTVAQSQADIAKTQLEIISALKELSTGIGNLMAEIRVWNQESRTKLDLILKEVVVQRGSE